ncbi:MAG: AsmA family protein [Odoribacter sp.]|nr:AsmA family protein [Odoribacter sp.]
MAQKNQKPRWKKVLKRLFITLFLLIVLLIGGTWLAISLILTPERLTPLVEKTANKYLDATISIGEINLTFFKTFPNLGLDISDATIISRLSKDTVTEYNRRDSLMYIENCRITINPVEYFVQNKIIIKKFILDSPRIYSLVDSAGNANWNIWDFSAEVEEETEEKEAMADDTLRLDIKNIRIRNGNIIYNNRQTQTFGRISGLDVSLDGEFDPQYLNMKLDMSSRSISLRHEDKRLLRRMQFAVKTDVQINRDSLICHFHRTIFNVNGMRFGAGGTVSVDTTTRALDVDIRYGIDIPSLQSLLDLVPASIIEKDQEADVKGQVLCRGTIKGLYNKELTPIITSDFKINDGYIAYKGMPSRIDSLNTEFEAYIDFRKEQRSSINLKKFSMQGGKNDIDISGFIDDILNNPTFKMDINAVVDFDEMTQIFSLVDGVICKGQLETALKTDVLFSDIMDGNYGKLKLGGTAKADRISIFIPEDSTIIRVNSARAAFATNREDRREEDRVNLLNGIIGYSGLRVNFQNKLRVRMDTTYMTFKTTPLQDTSSIATVNSALKLGKTTVIVKDTLLLGLHKADVKATLKPSPRDKKVPRIESTLKVDSLVLRAGENRLNMTYADIALNATRDRRRDSMWIPSGHIDCQEMRAYTPYFPVRISMQKGRVNFNMRQVALDSTRIRLGRSDMTLTGKIDNLGRAFFRKDTLYAQLSVASRNINCNQLMAALDEGMAYMNRSKEEKQAEKIIISEENDIDNVSVVSDSIEYSPASSVIVIPPRLDFTLRLDIDKILFGNLVLEDIDGEMVMRDQKVKVTDFNLVTADAKVDVTGIYTATDTLSAYTAFAMKLNDVKMDTLVYLFPSLDTLLPMLRSFEGLVDFYMGAETQLNSELMVDIPTLRGAVSIDGQNLVLMDGETFAEISKKLMFKNKKRNLIDSVSVELTIQDGMINIFPFLLEIDRYKAAIGGQHNIDMTFNYHISILKSPLPFRAGVDIYGDIDKFKFKITSAKYKDIFIPTRKAKVDSAQISLQNRIRTMLRGT